VTSLLPRSGACVFAIYELCEQQCLDVEASSLDTVVLVAAYYGPSQVLGFDVVGCLNLRVNDLEEDPQVSRVSSGRSIRFEI
jgi:hypothetical protein